MVTTSLSGSIKVNIERSSLGRLGKGSVFRNLKGGVLLQFGREISVNLTVHAEVLALRKGLLVATVSR